MAQLAVAAAGAAVGSLFGAPQVGWLVGSFIGGELFAEKQKVEGPRLGDLQVQASTYGMGIPQVFGSMRLAGNVIWARPLIEKRRKSSAGKGGGGQTVVSYEYFATFAVAFAKGPVDAIRRVWADGKPIVDLSETGVQGKSFRYGERIYRLHLGTETQAPDPVIEMHEGAGNVPAYRGLAYITFDELPLKDFGNRIPNITAEIVATATTVHPSQQLDLLSQGVDNWGRNGWLLDPERPYIYNVWGGWLLKVNRVSGQVVYRVDIASKPELVAWWDVQGWQGGPDPYAYAIDSVSGDLFLALNGLSRTTFARLDPPVHQRRAARALRMAALEAAARPARHRVGHEHASGRRGRARARPGGPEPRLEPR
jgi:hypothetical protein